MPAKKSSQSKKPPKKKKPSGKKKKGKQTKNAAVKKNIKQAVDNIPQMIVREIQEKKPTWDAYTQENTPLYKSATYHKAQRKRKAIVWMGVGIVTIVICLMWFFNISTLVYDTKQKPAQEKQLLNIANQEIQALFAGTVSSITPETTPTEEDNTADVSTIKNTLSSILGAFMTTTSTSSTVATTTTDISTSTTP